MRRLAALALLSFALLVAAACDAPAAQHAGSNTVVVPALSNDEPHTLTRSFGMGFFVTPSIPTVPATVAFVPQVAKVTDYAMIQREVPWTRILAGDSFDKIIDDEYVQLVALLRGNGLKIVLLVDPLDGLDRTHEALEAQKNHKTLLDADTRATHAAWVKELVTRIKPDYIGLASEINTLGAHGNATLYADIKAMCNALAPQLRQASPSSRIFVSFQVEDAWQSGPFPKSDVDQFAMVRDFDVDAVGISSYPGFVYSDPAQIPANYYQRFADAGGKPLLMAEGGWSSAGGPNFTPQKESAYYARMFDLLDGVHAELVILLLFNDLNLADPSWGLPADRQATLQNFANMGIVDTSGAPKPAYAVWQERFKRPLQRSP